MEKVWGRRLLEISCACGLGSLVLGAQYGLARWFGTASLAPGSMIRILGFLGGVGFVVAGLAGWTASVPQRAVHR